MSRGARSGSGSVAFGQSYGSSRPIAYTPTVTWAGNTITTQSGFYLKTPGKLEVWISFIESAGVAAAPITATIPTGYTAVTHTGSLSAMVGWFSRSTNAANPNPMLIVAGGTTQVISVANATGVVDTWVGYFSIPTLT